MELISVIIPVYNAENWIESSLKSIIEQSYNNIEILIVDGGSTDRTIDTINNIKDSRIKLFNTKIYSFTKKLNYAITQATGTWIARMDADDICHPDRIKDQVNFLNKQKNTVLISTFETFLTPNSYVIHEKLPEWKYIELTDKDFVQKSYYNDGSMMFRRDTAIECGLYDERFEKDTSLWYKLLARGKGYIINSQTYLYRMHKGQMTERQLNNTAEWFELRKIYHKDFDKNINNKSNDGFINRYITFIEFSLAEKNLIMFTIRLVKLFFRINFDFKRYKKIVREILNVDSLKFWKKNFRIRPLYNRYVITNDIDKSFFERYNLL